MGSLLCTQRPQNDSAVSRRCSEMDQLVDSTCSGMRSRYAPRTARTHRRFRRPRSTRIPQFLRLFVDLDLHLRIVYAIVGGFEPMADFGALNAACFDICVALEDPNHVLWLWKMQAVLGVPGSLRYGLPMQLNSITSLRTLCVTLLATERLLHSALAFCDWFALSDIGVLLESIGITDVHWLFLTLRAFVMQRQYTVSSQCAHWLLELANGKSTPWADCYVPTQHAKEMDRLRRWLHHNVSVEIMAWGDVKEFHDGDLPQELQDNFGSRIGYVAPLLILATECVRPPSYSCLTSVLSLEELLVGVETAHRRIGETGSFPLWAFTLLLIGQCLRGTADHFLETPRDRLTVSEELVVGKGWHGLAIAWHPSAHEEDPGQESAHHRIEELHFPELCVDKGWLYMQFGNRGPTGLADGSVVNVQLAARLVSGAECYFGHWLEQEHGFAQPLPAVVFSIGQVHGGLRKWMDPASSSFQSELSESKSSDIEASAIELFGTAGSIDDGIIRCFHLTRSQ